MIKTLVFDWGETLMRELPDFPGKLIDAPEVFAMPGIAAALAALQPQYMLIVASNADISTPDDVRGALRRVDLDAYFTQFHTSAVLGVSKPDPAFFAAVLDAAGCAPSEAVMIGDTFGTDVLGAKRAGLHAVWYNVRGEAIPPGSPVRPDATIAALADLPAAIRALDGGS
ncbi:HAD family hydrolase [Aggregatilinea lenta]|uniref:HAD family hydrolase n=1 Tax=Aggregatilinea lenta TaxID=913108 RepID=UPI000E5BEEB3|nr:HAD family hydrolase [Aggregatilinea lenta]